MAEAMIRGVIAAGVPARSVVVYDVDKKRRDALQRTCRVKPVRGNTQVVQASDVVVIAVKPQTVPEVLSELAGNITGGSKPLFLSIAAGVPVSALAAGLGRRARIVRAMPNTPGLIQKGMAAYYAAKGCTAADKKTAHELLAAIGDAVEVKQEKLMDPVTGLSGSGPAYIYVIIEALADAGVKMGLDRDVAVRLAARTAEGAAAMILQTGRHPGELKDMVTSPGGTTAAGLSEIEKRGLRGILIRAVEAATRRSEELGKGK